MNRCPQSLAAALIACSAFNLVGCAGGGSAPSGSSPAVVAKPTDAQVAATLGRVKSLAGTWTMPGPDGKLVVASVFAVSSNGSVVREIMFPGSPHEMTNVYHMDGPDLIMTHYCAAGNQPRMRCRPAGASSTRLVFTPDSVTNLHDAQGGYMAAMTIEFKPDGTVTQKWTERKNGKDGEHANFDLTRQK